MAFNAHSNNVATGYKYIYIYMYSLCIFWRVGRSLDFLSWKVFHGPIHAEHCIIDNLGGAWAF